MKKERFAKIPVSMIKQIGEGVLSYQEFCALCYMLVFCGIREGVRQPYMLGRKGIMQTLQISESRAKRILISLQNKGFIHPMYRMVDAEGVTVETKSLKHARALRLGDNSGFAQTHYRITKRPNGRTGKRTNGN